MGADPNRLLAVRQRERKVYLFGIISGILTAHCCQSSLQDLALGSADVQPQYIDYLGREKGRKLLLEEWNHHLVAGKHDVLNSLLAHHPIEKYLATELRPSTNGLALFFTLDPRWGTSRSRSSPVGNRKEPSVPAPGRLLGFLLKVYRIDLQVFAVLGSSDFCHDLGTRRLGRIA